MQQGAQTEAHVTSNNVWSCWQTIICLLARGYLLAYRFSRDRFDTNGRSESELCKTKLVLSF